MSKDDGGFEVRSAGASAFGAPQLDPLTPSIFQLSLAVKSLDDAPASSSSSSSR